MLAFPSRIHRDHAGVTHDPRKHNGRRVRRPYTYARLRTFHRRRDSLRVDGGGCGHVGSAAYVAHVRKNKSYCFWNRVYLGGPPVTLVRQSDKKFNDVIALSKHGQPYMGARRVACVYARYTTRNALVVVDARAAVTPLAEAQVYILSTEKNKITEDKAWIGAGKR